MFDYLECAVSVLKDQKEQDALPAFVKKADFEYLVDKDMVAESGYLLKKAEAFPVFDQASTWLAAKVLSKYGSDIAKPVYTDLVVQVKQACELYGLDPDLCNPEVAAPEKTKVAYYALHKNTNNGMVKKYPIHTKEAVEQSIASFNNGYSNDLVQWRRPAALTITKMANIHDVHIEPESKLAQYASPEIKDEQLIKDAIHSRISMTGDKWRSLYSEVSDRISDVAPEKLAAVLQRVDNAAGVAPYWGVKVEDPVLSVFQNPTPAIKQACDEEVEIPEPVEKKASVVSLGGKAVPLHVLYAQPLDWYSDVLGEDIADSLKGSDGELDESMVEAILSSLPNNDQTVLINNLTF